MSARKVQLEPVHVFVRLRSCDNSQAKNSHILEVANDREICIKQQHDRRFKFNRIFLPNVPQLQIYKVAVASMIPKVLESYNCAVILFGPTDSGKTHTLLGDIKECIKPWQDLKSEAGCISRALSNLLEELQQLDGKSEHAMRVSYVEIYKEELFDLLRDDYEEQPELRIIEDSEQKGTVYIQNLTMRTVYAPPEIDKVFAEASRNFQQSPSYRNNDVGNSHRIFTIHVHTRTHSLIGADTMKSGKLSFVELAGAEHFVHQGQEESNSVRTFNSVLEALGERRSHVPYRDSKLTRLLQDSLERGKLSFITTLSPDLSSTDDLLHTLEYAKNVKSIAIKPEVNKSTAKSNVVNCLNMELASLEKDLMALRSGEGFYIDAENYEQLVAEKNTKAKAAAEKTKIATKCEEEYQELQTQIQRKKKEIASVIQSLDLTKRDALRTKKSLLEGRSKLEKEMFLSKHYEKANREVDINRKDLVSLGDAIIEHTDKLMDKIDYLNPKITQNKETSKKFSDILYNQVSTALNSIKSFDDEQMKCAANLIQTTNNFYANVEQNTDRGQVDDLELKLERILNSSALKSGDCTRTSCDEFITTCQSETEDLLVSICNKNESTYAVRNEISKKYMNENQHLNTTRGEIIQILQTAKSEPKKSSMFEKTIVESNVVSSAWCDFAVNKISSGPSCSDSLPSFQGVPQCLKSLEEKRAKRVIQSVPSRFRLNEGTPSKAIDQTLLKNINKSMKELNALDVSSVPTFENNLSNLSVDVKKTVDDVEKNLFQISQDLCEKLKGNKGRVRETSKQLIEDLQRHSCEERTQFIKVLQDNLTAVSKLVNVVKRNNSEFCVTSSSLLQQFLKSLSEASYFHVLDGIDKGQLSQCREMLVDLKKATIDPGDTKKLEEIVDMLGKLENISVSKK